MVNMGQKPLILLLYFISVKYPNFSSFVLYNVFHNIKINIYNKIFKTGILGPQENSVSLWNYKNNINVY